MKGFYTLGISYATLLLYYLIKKMYKHDESEYEKNNNHLMHSYYLIGDADITKAGDIKDRKSDDDMQVNVYNRTGSLYDTGLSWVTLGFEPDDLKLAMPFDLKQHI